jgi:putative tryptophan/tyrosine transport system substrate-binding protein
MNTSLRPNTADGPRTRRRSIVAWLGCASAGPWSAMAQKRGTVYRIGIVSLAPTSDIEGPQPRSPQVAMLLRTLSQMGYAHGEHYVTLSHGVAGNPLGMDGLVRELVRQKPDVIVVTGAAVAPLKQTTATIPVVMTAALDPVAAGLVPNLVRPGGNLTGLSLQASEATGKRLQLLKEVVPGAGPVAVVWNQSSIESWRAAQVAAKARGWALSSFEINDSAQWEYAFHSAAAARANGVMVLAAQVLFPRAKAVAELAAKLKLPAMYELRPFVDAGGLMGYGPDIVDIWRRAAGYVDKILDGAKPGDLPIEQPTRFELIVNLRTARELGLSVPKDVLLRADEVIR